MSEHTERTLSKGCVVFMKGSSGLTGYGNPQCVSDVHHESLGTISLYGHNQHYKIYDIDKIVEYPVLTCNSHKKLLATLRVIRSQAENTTTNPRLLLQLIQESAQETIIEICQPLTKANKKT